MEQSAAEGREGRAGQGRGGGGEGSGSGFATRRIIVNQMSTKDTFADLVLAKCWTLTDAEPIIAGRPAVSPSLLNSPSGATALPGPTPTQLQLIATALCWKWFMSLHQNFLLW